MDAGRTTILNASVGMHGGEARAEGGEAKEHLETKQEACARDGQIGCAGVRGTSANKANQSRGGWGGGCGSPASYIYIYTHT